MCSWNVGGYTVAQQAHQRLNGLDLISRLERHATLDGLRVADLGSGEGGLTKILAQKVGEQGQVYAIDRDANMVAYGCSHNAAGNIGYFCEEFRVWLKTANVGLHVVFSNAALHWLNDEAEFDDLLKCVWCRLETRGILALRFSLLENGLTAKAFLERALADFLGGREIRLHRSPFAFQKCVPLIISNKFELLDAEEKRYCALDTEAHVLNWLLYTQPIGEYIRSDCWSQFEDFVRQRWQHDPVKIDGHHGIFLARKSKGSVTTR